MSFEVEGGFSLGEWIEGNDDFNLDSDGLGEVAFGNVGVVGDECVDDVVGLGLP